MKLLQPASVPALPPWEFHFVKLQEQFPGVWGEAPNTENQNAQRFGSASMPAVSR
jgi:hypothetical protein